jgi:hypothetical protein
MFCSKNYIHLQFYIHMLQIMQNAYKYTYLILNTKFMIFQTLRDYGNGYVAFAVCNLHLIICMWIMFSDDFFFHLFIS